MDTNPAQIHAYDDIIDLPRPVDTAHPPMSRAARAAQFAPFAALTGYGEAIAETVRQTDARLPLDAYRMARLDDALRQINDAIAQQPEVTFTVFIEDAAKTGGSYQTKTGYVRRLDLVTRQIHLCDGTRIPLDDIYEMQSTLFQTFDDWGLA